MGYLADRLSVNVELPSEQSLHLLAPDKGRHSIFRPMKQISVAGEESRQELTLYRHAPKFAPAGQSTQMIVGASPETDYHILQLSEGMYQKYGLKRVFYSAYIPVSDEDVYKRQVKSRFGNDLIEGVAIEGNVFPAQRRIGFLDPERIIEGKRVGYIQIAFQRVAAIFPEQLCNVSPVLRSFAPFQKIR